MCEPTAPTFHPRTPCSHLTHFVPTHTHTHSHTHPPTYPSTRTPSTHTPHLPTYHTFPHTTPSHTPHPPTHHIPSHIPLHSVPHPQGYTTIPRLYYVPEEELVADETGTLVSMATSRDYNYKLVPFSETVPFLWAQAIYLIARMLSKCIEGCGEGVIVEGSVLRG